MSKEPTVLACMAIVETLGMGSATDGQGDNWRNKTRIEHLLKANTHLGEAMRQEAGCSKSEEEHLKLAITRLALAMCCE